jgi:cytochrome c553
MLRTLALTASFAVLTFAAVQPAAAQELDGKKLFQTKTCIACHGRDGKKPIQTYPELAGQQVDYLLRQMDDIASGARLSGPDARGYPRTQGMKDVMHLVAPEERKAMATWLAAQPPAPPRAVAEPIPAERLTKGKALYDAKECTACHGPDGKEPLTDMPALAALKQEYIVLQMKEIRGGVRKNGLVETMLPFVEKLTDDEITLIADFLSQTDRTAK